MHRVNLILMCFYFLILQSKNVRLIAVGVGSRINGDELKEIADGKRENVVHVDKFDDLVSNENNVLFASCQPGVTPIYFVLPVVDCWAAVSTRFFLYCRLLLPLPLAKLTDVRTLSL